MADILVYLVSYSATKISGKVATARSPVIPEFQPPPLADVEAPPTMEDLAPVYTREPLASPPIGSSLVATRSSPQRTLTSPPPPSPHPPFRPATRARSASSPLITKHETLTEFGLRECQMNWKIRYQSLYLRLAALLDAMRRGLRNSWAGRVSWDHCDQIRLAILEAEYVEKKLSEAVRWCEEKGLQKLPLVALVKPGKRRYVEVSASSGRPVHLEFLWHFATIKNSCYFPLFRSSVSRPTHSERPPSLADLPSPLPVAIPAIFPRLTVPVPPHVLRGGPREDESGNGLPPAYTRHYEPLRGERLIQRATWGEEERMSENRVADGADAIVLIR